MSTKKEFTEEKKESWGSPRNVIAVGVTGLVLLATVAVAIYSVCFAKNPSTDFIGQTLLPLWATWVGTIIAFYFGKDNFEAATKSYRDVIKSLTPEDKIASIAVKEIMIPIKDIVHMDLTKSLDKSIVDDILENIDFKTYNRFAFFDDLDVVKHIIHKSTFTYFLVKKVKESGVAVESITLKAILEENEPTIKNMLDYSLSFVSINSNLLDAKKAMEAIPECQDVFVTQNGRRNEPVLGLITNNMILEKSKV
jgi:hypothetical protein